MPWTYAGNFISIASDSSSVTAFMRTIGFAFVDDLHAPIDALLAAGGNFDLLHEVVALHRRRGLSLGISSETVTSFSLLEIVVDVRREDDFVLLHEEPRRLQADDEVLARDDFGFAAADLRAVAHRPDLDLPAGEVLGHVELDLGDAVLVGVEHRPSRRRCRRSWCGRSVRRQREHRRRVRRFGRFACDGFSICGVSTQRLAWRSRGTIAAARRRRCGIRERDAVGFRGKRIGRLPPP